MREFHHVSVALFQAHQWHQGIPLPIGTKPLMGPIKVTTMIPSQPVSLTLTQTTNDSFIGLEEETCQENKMFVDLAID